MYKSHCNDFIDYSSNVIAEAQRRINIENNQQQRGLSGEKNLAILNKLKNINERLINTKKIRLGAMTSELLTNDSHESYQAILGDLDLKNTFSSQGSLDREFVLQIDEMLVDGEMANGFLLIRCQGTSCDILPVIRFKDRPNAWYTSDVLLIIDYADLSLSTMAYDQTELSNDFEYGSFYKMSLVAFAHFAKYYAQYPELVACPERPSSIKAKLRKEKKKVPYFNFLVTA